MKLSLFRSRKPVRPNGAFFRPTLECLEARDVPATVTTAGAAFSDLSAAVSAVQTDLSSGNTSTLATDLARVQNDMGLLSANASSFTPSDRQRIDTALVSAGISLYTSGASAYAQNPLAGWDTAILGVDSAVQGLVDAQFAGLSNTGTQTLS